MLKRPPPPSLLRPIPAASCNYAQAPRFTQPIRKFCTSSNYSTEPQIPLSYHIEGPIVRTITAGRASFEFSAPSKNDYALPAAMGVAAKRARRLQERSSSRRIIRLVEPGAVPCLPVPFHAYVACPLEWCNPPAR